MLVGVMAACSSIYVEKADTVDDEAGSRANYFAEISRLRGQPQLAMAGTTFGQRKQKAGSKVSEAKLGWASPG